MCHEEHGEPARMRSRNASQYVPHTTAHPVTRPHPRRLLHLWRQPESRQLGEEIRANAGVVFAAGGMWRLRDGAYVP